MATETELRPTELSPAEAIKAESGYLRGSIAAEEQDGASGFGKASEVLLKFHGTYQQDDRDHRGGGEHAPHIFMVRSRVPSGILTSAQFLKQIDLGDEIGNTTIRLTSRQAIQHHGVIKANLKACIRRINEMQLSTLAACGDVNRNVMCCPAPYKNEVYEGVQKLAHAIAMHFAPRTRAYHELWLTDTSTGVTTRDADLSKTPEEVEPIYGAHYLPRKFKMAIGFPHDNCTDVYTNDAGLLALIDKGRIRGYNVLVGGGLGVTPANKKTFPALAQKLCFAKPENVIEVLEAVVKVQRDFGNRVDRKVARLKYLIHKWGIDAFREKVESYLGFKLAPPDAEDVYGFNDHIGWDEQGDGKLFYGLNIENGRIKDTDSIRLKTALREVCSKLNPGIRLTSHQSLIFTDIRPEDRPTLESTLTSHGVPLSESVSTVRRWSMACVAWPTCGLSITESERALPGMIDQLEVVLARLGLSRERFTVRMTGCPNGCARPYNSDIGLVGKAKNKYTILTGGRVVGNRLNFILKDMVPAEEVVPVLDKVLTYYKSHRAEGEELGDFCFRMGKEALAAVI
jgi:sulfite reductase (ferredoxin)